MNFDRMRALLLEQAIQGKLVPQLTTKPHRILQIKREQEPVPFSIPEQWIWISAKDAFQLLSGRDLVKSEIFDDLPEGVVYPYITGASQIENSSVLINRWTRNCAVKSRKGDLLLTCKGTVGKTAFNTIGDMHIARQIMALRPNREVIEPKYLKVFIDAIADRLGKEAKSMIPGIDRKTLLNKLIPLPPLEEQSRIVTRLDEAFAEIDRAEKAYQELQTLSGVLRGQILQEAIQGKLVPQLDSEEAVEQIGDAPEDVPFAIPEKWKWTSMSSVVDVRDGTHDTPKYVEKGIPFVTSKNLKLGVIDFSTVRYISQDDHKEFIKRSKVDEGDILMAMIGTIGNALIVPKGLPEFSIKNVALLKKKEDVEISFSYVLLVLKAFEQLMDKQSSGSVQKFVSLKYLRNMPFPVPPLKEQERIVNKVQELLKQVDALSSK